ncbi:DinB family protein [Amphibacillus cookii]|uniref:DinB family protein n=1 Tax=Amphibacillus cookii TaxID=767787 RepID=UPI001EF9675A|nr:DinB family protein [Amphibacillus cookii]MBM7541978.1 hypothetical protein [Amphibacillus cookii]
MQNESMTKHFKKIYDQRETFNHLIAKNHWQIWDRPQINKWSIGETYYHLYLMIKRFRQLNTVYLPLAKPIAYIWKHSLYPIQINNIYQEYSQKHNKAMRAPSIIMPPKHGEQLISTRALFKEITHETKKLESMVTKLNERIAGHIRYPDPIAHYPNLIQSIDLIGIHEQHHFNLCQKYYRN